MGREKATLELVTKKFEERGYTLLAKEYVNSKTPLEYICNKHPEEVRTIRLASFNSGKGCRKCSNERKGVGFRLSYEFVKNKFEERGYILLSTEYVNNHTKLKYICPKHPDKEREITYGSFNYGSGCRGCGIESRKIKLKEQGYPAARAAAKRRAIPYAVVIAEFKAHGLEVITKEEDFINTLHPITFECSRHPGEIQQKSYAALHHYNQGCKICGLERRSGENHYAWNAEKTDEEREVRRQTKLSLIWTKAVFEKDNYTCEKCNKRGGKLEAHHKDGFHWCEVRRYDISNGVTLCEPCHKDFHDKNGYWNTTEEQYEEWVK